MRVSSVSLIALLALFPVTAHATPRDGAAETEVERARKYALGYFLPKGRAAASFSQRLVRCPAKKGDPIVVESRAQILPAVVPDYARLYRIDVRARFLVKRTTELSLHPGGTIKTVNATVEGQGGPVIVSALKIAAFGAAQLIGPGAPLTRGPDDEAPSTSCRAEILDLIKEREAQAQALGEMEAAYTVGGLSDAEGEELELQRNRLVVLDNALTISSEVKVIDGADDGTHIIPALDYTSWFEGKADPRDIEKLPARAGARITWKANADTVRALGDASFISADKLKDFGKEPEAALYYRRPVPVSIVIAPCIKIEIDPKTQKPICAEDASIDAAPLHLRTVANFPQRSGLFRLPIGRGGLFGSRSIAAEFDENGAPMKLSYGSDPGAAAIASTVDAAREAGTTLRDARKDALEREKARLALRKEIRELRDALDNPPTPAVAGQ